MDSELEILHGRNKLMLKLHIITLFIITIAYSLIGLPVYLLKISVSVGASLIAIVAFLIWKRIMVRGLRYFIALELAFYTLVTMYFTDDLATFLGIYFYIIVMSLYHDYRVIIFAWFINFALAGYYFFVRGSYFLKRYDLEEFMYISVNIALVTVGLLGQIYVGKRMLNDLKKKHADVLEAKEKQKDAEMSALEAQINPHFLYNTLNSISWLAIDKGEHEISRRLKSLAQILRYSISKSTKAVPIREEVEWLKEYLYLQQSRFGQAFECIVDISQELFECRVHKLLLQPFIENSIIHGFEETEEGGVLKITGIPYKEDMIKIIIKDNGKGINADTVKALNSGAWDSLEAKGTGLGIKNVFDRIKNYYGDKGHWNITSEVGIGTEVTLILPKL